MSLDRGGPSLLDVLKDLVPARVLAGSPQAQITIVLICGLDREILGMVDRSYNAVAGHAKCRVEQRPVAVALDTGEQTERRIELQSCTEMVAIQTRSLKLKNVFHH